MKAAIRAKTPSRRPSPASGPASDCGSGRNEVGRSSSLCVAERQTSRLVASRPATPRRARRAEVSGPGASVSTPGPSTYFLSRRCEAPASFGFFAAARFFVAGGRQRLEVFGLALEGDFFGFGLGELGDAFGDALAQRVAD